jgi:hypothetical protein
MEPNALECIRVPWNVAECHEIQSSTTKSKIVICVIAYINIVFVQDINTTFVINTIMLSYSQVSELPPHFVMRS